LPCWRPFCWYRGWVCRLCWLVRSNALLIPQPGHLFRQGGL
jgi:hypothetical protein